MVIQIESLYVENIGCFRGEHQLKLRGDVQIPEVVRGRSATGKTTLTNAIYLCLSGHRRNNFSPNDHRVQQLDGGGSVESKISLVISDPEIDSRFRFTRTLRTSTTRRGPVHAIDSLKAEKEEHSEWVRARSAPALDSVFPAHSLTYSILDSESTIGNENWGDVGLYDLVESLGEAAARQSAARGLELPEFYSGDESLRKELIDRINEILSGIDNRYLVELGEGGLVGKHPDRDPAVPVPSLPAGQIQVISQTAALVAGELMPATPPLVGDTLYGRLDTEYRRKMFDVLRELDRQALLFLMEAELDGLDVDPGFELVLAEKEPNCRITPLQ